MSSIISVPNHIVEGTPGRRTISTISVHGTEYELEAKPSQKMMDQIIEKLKLLNMTPVTVHKCHNCGGSLELKIDQHIFKCPYCDSVYAVGIDMRYDAG